MTKNYCDLCGAEVTNSAHKNHIVLFGKEHANGGKTAIEVSVHIGLRNHPTGFGGPPDLCLGCKAKLVRELSNIIDHGTAED